MSTRRVIVTGGTRGIGAAISTLFKDNGYKVVAVYAGNEGAAKEFENKTGITAIKGDVSDFKSCQEIVGKAKQLLGGNIEILVNNAGITRDGMLHKNTAENWGAVLHTNLFSVFNMTRCVIEEMREQKFGRVISMSSVNAHGAAGQTNYSAAKAGIEGFTKALALEGAKVGITANAVAPGYINTQMVAEMPEAVLSSIVAKVPTGRLGEAHEIARTILFLAHEDSSFITGAVIPVNGGLRV